MACCCVFGSGSKKSSSPGKKMSEHELSECVVWNIVLLMKWLQLPFDCNSTSLRLFDDLRQQETQLSLTNRATRLEVSQGHQTGTIPYVRYGFLLVCYSNFVHFWDILLQKCRDLENLVKDPWRLLKLTPFDREHMTSYWCSIVITMTLSRVVSEMFNVEKISRPWNCTQEPIKVI